MTGKVQRGGFAGLAASRETLNPVLPAMPPETGVTVATPLRYKLFLKVAQRVWRVQRGVTLGAEAVVIDERSRVRAFGPSRLSGWLAFSRRRRRE